MSLPHGLDVDAALVERISFHWRRVRVDDALVGRMPPLLVAALNDLTQRNPTCECLVARDSGGARHDMMCPAYRSPRR